MTPQAPHNVRIVHADGSIQPVDVEFIGTDPREILDDIHIINRWQIVTETFMAEGDRIEADFIPDDCSIIARRVVAK